MSEIVKKWARQMFVDLYGGEPANYVDTEIGQQIFKTMDAAIREAVEEASQKRDELAKLLDDNRNAAEQALDARRDAIRECVDRGWLQHRETCQSLQSTWRTADGPPQCDCGLHDFKAVELAPKGGGDDS